ncbi:hypothetical protein V3C99_013356 [Haemonchus contortus]
MRFYWLIFTIIACFVFGNSVAHSIRSLKDKAPNVDDEDSDSRAVSSNVDLDAVDSDAYERMRNALHSIHARIGAIGDR